MSITPYAMYESRDVVAASHAAVLNGFINQARRYIEREKELVAQAQAEAEQAQEYIDTHADLLDVIPYNEIVFQSMQKQNEHKREQVQKDLKPENTILIDGQECIKTDEWESGDDVYVLGYPNFGITRHILTPFISQPFLNRY